MPTSRKTSGLHRSVYDRMALYKLLLLLLLLLLLPFCIHYDFLKDKGCRSFLLAFDIGSPTQPIISFPVYFPDRTMMSNVS